MSEIGSKRITYKRICPNPQFQEWLEKLYKDAKAKKSKLEPMLQEALDSLSKYPVPLNSGAECAILKGFDNRLCLFLDQQLAKHKSYLSLQSLLPTSSAGINVETEHNIEPPATSLNSPAKPPKEYIPAFRSGGYAILIALLEHSFLNPSKPAMNKNDIISKAQKHSEESFIRRRPGTFYTAWNSISTLRERELVKTCKRKKHQKLEFYLTEEGTRIAKELLNEARYRPTMNDIIFNNDDEVHSQQIDHNLNNLNKETERAVIQQEVDFIHMNTAEVQTSAETPHVIDCMNLDTGKDARRLIAHQVDEFVDLDAAESVVRLGTKQASAYTDLNDVVIELEAGNFEIILLIDKNEVAGGVNKKNDPTVAQFNKYPNLQHEYRSLKVGDFTWIARHKTDKHKELVLPYIIERKRMDDLGSSIKDGRFHEQKFRLRRCGLANVIYMVENYGSNKHLGLPVTSLMQALANTRVQDGFKVHITDSFSNSTRFLAMMTRRLTIKYMKRNLKGRNAVPKDGELMTFEYFTSISAKNKSLTVTETFIKLLLQLKGMSVEKALAITNVYNTPRSLIQEYSKFNAKEGEMLLANLKFGSSRNVGPVISKSIYLLFSSKDLI